MRFYIPPNLQRDFTDSLNALGTDAVINFDPLNKVKVRLDKVNYRTRNGITNSDDVVFAELSSNLKMGDYLSYKNETMLITQLKENEFPKCYEFTTTTCNTKLNVTRYQLMVQDEDGNIITPEGDVNIAEDLFCSTLFNSFQFKTTVGNVGVVPENQLLISCQFNDITKDVKIGDKFVWFDEYRIISIDRSQIDISNLYGLLSFNAERVVS